MLKAINTPPKITGGIIAVMFKNRKITRLSLKSLNGARVGATWPRRGPETLLLIPLVCMLVSFWSETPVLAHGSMPTAEEGRPFALEKAGIAAEGAHSEYGSKGQYRGSYRGPGEIRMAQSGREKPPSQGGPSYTPNYDINKAFGSKGKIVTSGPDPNIVTITLYMPEVGVYRKTTKRVFGPQYPDFRNVNVSGIAYWETLFYKESARHQTIKLVLWHKGKPIRHRVTKTDGWGVFKFDMPVNKKGRQGVKNINFNITRHLSTYAYWPPEYGVVPPDPATGPTGQSAPQKPTQPIPSQSDWKRIGFSKVSKLHAAWKDYQHNKVGGRGTPNIDQWRKNHAAGRDDINTLILIIDLAIGPATTQAQLMDNANKVYKRLTGKPLPFVKEQTKAQKEAAKGVRNVIWEKMNSTLNYDTVGR